MKLKEMIETRKMIRSAMMISRKRNLNGMKKSISRTTMEFLSRINHMVLVQQRAQVHLEGRTRCLRRTMLWDLPLTM